MASASHAVPKLEADLYYFSIRRHLDPRTLKDVFTPPVGPEQYPRLMQLLPVYYHDKLDRDNWATIRDEVVNLLDEREIRLTSVDLTWFRWEEQNLKADSKSEMATSYITIWVGVLPYSLASDLAYESSKDILRLLRTHNIQDIDVAYRESEAKLFTGPELLAPVDDDDPPSRRSLTL